MPRLLIAASGTGGHLYPAIAVAKKLSDDWDITWLGVSNRLETSILRDRYELLTINVGGLQGSFINKILRFFQLIISIRKVLLILRTRRTQVVFTTGGYIAAPVIIGAFLRRIPLVLHESNSMPGRVTRLLARFSTVTAIGMPPAFEVIKGIKPVLTGTPVRSGFKLNCPLPSWAPRGDGPLIVIMGGSQGALGINKMIGPVLLRLLQENLRIVHITGNNDSNLQKFIHSNFIQKEYIDDMPALLSNTDLVISRSGAGALAELAVSGVPAILIPYLYASDNHQEMNAQYFAQHGAAIIVHEDVNSKELVNIILRILRDKCNSDNKNYLSIMKEKMVSLAIPDADQKIVKILDHVLK
tara:strand:- start:14816 stop:15883 length:1068 start_codon:yes stop_codon:yes gene_type:complete